MSSSSLSIEEHHAGFEVFTVVVMKIAIFWNTDGGGAFL
jgi:hypothetical protein